MKDYNKKLSELTEDTLNIIPYGTAILGRVNVLASSKSFVCQIVRETEFIVQQEANIIVEAIDQ